MRRMIYCTYLSDFPAVSLAEASSSTETTSSPINPATETFGSDEKNPSCKDELFFNNLGTISL